MLRSSQPDRRRPPGALGSERPGRIRDDSGFSALEMAVIFPVTIFIVFGIVQFGIWYHANDIAQAAAQQAVRSASAYGTTQADCSTEAGKVLNENAHGLIIHTQIACNRGAQTATVTVAGDAIQVIPFIPLPVKATATAPVEAFRPPPRA
jgi:Flp pilus assembly protein TadG